MGEATERHVGRFPRQLRYPFEFRGDVHGGLRLRHLSLQRFHDTVPPFARRGPLGRFPRVLAPTAALRFPGAHRLALRCLRTPPSLRAHPRHARRRRDLPGSWATLARVPRSLTPVEPPRRTFGPCLATGAAVLPSALYTASASTTSGISGLYHAAHVLAVYASWPRLPVCCFTATQDSLPAGGQPCRSGLSPAGCYVRFLLRYLHHFLLTQASPGARTAPRKLVTRNLARRGAMAFGRRHAAPNPDPDRTERRGA